MTTEDPCVRSPFLLIVTQTEPKLYEYLRRSLARSPGAHVMLDRRRAERRENTAPTDLDRRRAADRRARPGIEDQLQARGWAVVHHREPPGIAPIASGAAVEGPT